jgi:hypothetical protein
MLRSDPKLSAFMPYLYTVTNGKICAQFRRFDVEKMGRTFASIFNIPQENQVLTCTGRTASQKYFFISNLN